MKHPLQKNKEQALEITSHMTNELNLSRQRFDQIGDEFHRVGEVSHAMIRRPL